MNGIIGTLFDRQVVEDLVVAVERMDRTEFDRKVPVQHARAFDTSRSNQKIGTLIDGALAQHRATQRAASHRVAGYMSPASPALSGTG
jgi:hypothetical protein